MESLESFAKAFFPKQDSPTSAYRGVLQWIGDDGIWHVRLNSSGTTSCVGFGDAEAGDMVLVIKHPNGHCSAIGGVSTGGGGGSGDRFYTHVQQTPSTVWEVTHGLGKHPSVTVVDSGGTVVIGEVDYTSADSVRLTFSAQFSGTAYFN